MGEKVTSRKGNNWGSKERRRKEREMQDRRSRVKGEDKGNERVKKKREARKERRPEGRE